MRLNTIKALPSEDKQFYPTPPWLAEKMLDGIKRVKYDTVLEPSAGKGDLVNALLIKCGLKERSWYSSLPEVDCIEIDENLRAILSKGIGGVSGFNDDDMTKVQIVHDDFLTYEPLKQYDLILMNPPFADGVRHLTKALDIQKNGGDIICLLNAETILNPYTKARKSLIDRLSELNAQYEYLSGEFSNAERKAKVDVVIVRVSIPKIERESEIFNRLNEAEHIEDPNTDTVGSELDFTDYIKSVVAHYHVEARCLLELYKTWDSLKPYIKSSFADDKENYHVYLTTDGKHVVLNPNELLRVVRRKYWQALFKNPKFVSKLPSKIQEEYCRSVERFVRYDFTEFNIRQIANEMNSRLKEGIETEIEAMYERLTEMHSYYPEMNKNGVEYNPYRANVSHYENAWSTNKVHKVGKKVILPTYGVFSSWSGEPDVYKAREALEDIERILNYFAGSMSDDVNFWDTLTLHFNQGITKNIQLKWFRVTFYKKGTVHITFTSPELIDHLNIYMGLGKNWLPPCYGKKRYADLDEEEKAVVDSFNDGEKEYESICQKSAYYLSKPVSNHCVAALTAGEVTV